MQSIKTPRDLPQKRKAPPPRNRRAPDDGRRVTKEEYWAKWYESPYPDMDVSYEWNNGILEAKPLPNHPQITLYRWFNQLLHCYVQVNPIAKFIDLETGVSMTVLDARKPSGKWEVVYKPDIGVVLNGNPAPWGAKELRAFEGVCDMIVEAVSDSTLAEVRRDTEEKRRGYALAGVQEYIILDPNDRYMRFYRLTPARRYAEIRPDASGVIRSEVLPGFQFRRADLLKLPDFRELALDEVYAGYVMPEHLEAVMRAEESAIRAERADERAAAEAVARRQAEERAAAEAVARRQAEERNRALQAEIARMRDQRS